MTVAELKQINQEQARTIQHQASTIQHQAKTIQEHTKTISDLRAKSSRKRPELDSELKKEIRHSTKLLESNGTRLDLHSNISDSHNQAILQRIAEGARGSDNQFSLDDAMEAAKRHFINLKDEMMRHLNGTQPKHAKSMRSHSRKDKKLKFRTVGLADPRCPLPPQDKLDGQAIMTSDYMSSDDDEVLKTPEGQKYRQVRYRPWESERLSRIKAVAYDTYLKYKVHKRDVKKVHLLRRDENSKPSDAPLPKGAPDWAVNLDFTK